MSKPILPDVEMSDHFSLRQLPHPERFRYRPEFDEQVRGYLKGPPNPEAPDPLQYHYCKSCWTTWLVGLDGPESANRHPSHNTRLHVYSGQSKRSMMVHVFGACTGDSEASGKASTGIFFGPGSSYNLKRALRIPTPTKQVAEIMTAAAAVRHVRKVVIPNREKVVRSEGGLHWECRWRDGWVTPPFELHRNNWMFRLIVVTDSNYLIETLCDDKQIWQLEPDIVHSQYVRGAPPHT